jgi:WD40 repeat protein
MQLCVLYLLWEQEMLRKFFVLFLALLLTTRVIAQQNTLLQTLQVSGNDVDWSSDGQRLAVTDAFNGVLVFSTNDFAVPTLTFPTNSRPMAVAFSPDGTLVAYGTDNGGVYVVEVTTGAQQELMGHSASINHVIFSPDGTRLVSSSEDDTTRIWNLSTGEHRILTGHTDATWSAAFDETGGLLITSAADEDLRLWDVNSGNLIATLSGHTGIFDEVRSVILRPHTATFVSGSTDDTLRLWNANQRGTAEDVIDTNSRGVTSLAFHPNGNVLAVGTENGSVQIWNFDARTVTSTLPGPGQPISNVAFSADGQYLAVAATEGVQVWGTFEAVAVVASGPTQEPTLLQQMGQMLSTPTLVEQNTTVLPTPLATATTNPVSTVAVTLSNIVASVFADNTNARSCPSTSCTVTQVVSRQDNLMVLGLEAGWYLVQLPSGQTGYIRSDLVNIPQGAEVPTISATVGVSNLVNNAPTPTEQPRSAEVLGTGSRTDPYSFGSPHEIRDGRLQVNRLRRNMSADVQRMNMFNSEPELDEEWILVNVTFYCDLPADQICNSSAIYFELVGDSGEIYDTELFTVIDNAFGGEIFGGGEVTGEVGFIIKKSDTDLLLIVNDLGDRDFFATE